MRHTVECKSASGMIEALTAIWQSVLERSSIGEQENFFELGGDPLKAAQLFGEIAQRFARDLPPMTIYQAPTIAALAAMLTQPRVPRIPPILMLKSGSKKPAVFITHGIGGNILDFFHVVKHIHSPHPIYGMQAKGIDGLDEPFDCVEDMAQFFLDAIKEIQPRGPYVLIGYSFGGLVTLEMAQRLTAMGEEVRLLVMLESYPDRRYLTLKQRLRLFSRLARHHAATLLHLPLPAAVSYLTNPAARLLHRPQEKGSSVPNHRPIGDAHAAAIKHMQHGCYLALRRFRPRFYHGKIKFVRAQVSFAFPDDPLPIWGKLADEFEVEAVPGDHSGIITTQFESLASVLSRYLQEAFSRK